MKKAMLVLGLASVMMACGSKGTETQVEEVQAVDSTEVVTDSVPETVMVFKLVQ